LTSGNVSEDDPSGRGVGVAMNGLRSAGTNVMLDGVANNDEFTASVGQMVPLDSVQEMGIITNNFTAEYGRADAGVVNVTTKSGTNAFHGTLYEFNRVSDLASNTSITMRTGWISRITRATSSGILSAVRSKRTSCSSSATPNGRGCEAKPTTSTWCRTRL
jgi:outer membrane receptor protein involved in Fe transport